MSNLLPVTLCFALSLAPGTQAARPKDPPPVKQGQVDEGLPTYYFLLGRYLEGENKIDAAVDAFKKAIELDPTSAEPRAELAALYARADRAREAVEAAEDALKVDPKNKEANRILGSVLAALAEQKQRLRPGDDVTTYGTRAIAALEIARGDGSGDLSIDLALARLYLDRDRPADAIPLLRRIVYEQPPQAPVPRRHDHLVEVDVPPHDRRGRGLHQIRQPRPRIRAAQRPDQRRREHYVPDQAQADQQDAFRARWWPRQSASRECRL